jgi:hypothetical protein
MRLGWINLRKIDLRHVSVRGNSLKNQGTRKHDVSYVYTYVDPTYVNTIVTTSIDYWKETIEVKKGTEDPEISVEIEVMKTEVMKYQTHEERKDSETHSHVVLRSVLTNSPNLSRVSL